MANVGIRQLRQRASELLRRVAAGESIEITNRGRPLALLGPLPGGSAIERLRASGDLEEARGSVCELPEPLERETGKPMPSSILSRLRRHER